MASPDLAKLRSLAPGSHVCWAVRDAGDYEELARATLAEAARTNEKPVVFGPDGAARDALAGSAVLAADPRTAFLAGGPLVPAAMFAMFDEQSRLARAEGYRGIRLVADMDWMLPLRPTAHDVVAFELLLDQHASRLGATIVCTYRAESFDANLLTGVACVHPIGVGEDQPPQFRLVAGANESWRLAGEVDVAVATNFNSAITTAVGAGPCVVDASDLEFIDVAGMRQLAKAAQMHEAPLRMTGVHPILQRAWKAARFDQIAPTVEFELAG